MPTLNLLHWLSWPQLHSLITEMNFNVQHVISSRSNPWSLGTDWAILHVRTSRCGLNDRNIVSKVNIFFFLICSVYPKVGWALRFPTQLTSAHLHTQTAWECTVCVSQPNMFTRPPSPLCPESLKTFQAFSSLFSSSRQFEEGFLNDPLIIGSGVTLVFSSVCLPSCFISPPLLFICF